MGTFVLHILFVAAGTVIGAVAGWLLRGGSSLPLVDSELDEVAATPHPELPAGKAERDFDQVEAVISRLHQLTASVAADVGEHSSRVQAINDELSSGADVVSAVERLMKVNELMQSQLQAAEKRMQQQAKEIESHVKEARTDALTKLANRRAFDDEIRHCVDELNAKGQPACVMMIDVDHFKEFNDTYGHQAGDEVLRSVGRVLRRESLGKEIVCRYGGEEFAVIYPGMDSQSVLPRAERARQAIAREIVEFQGLDLKVTASGGVAQLRPNEGGEDLVKRADDALYVAKEHGRNCGFYHDGKGTQPMKDAPPEQAAAPSPVEQAPATTTLTSSAKSAPKAGDEAGSQRPHRRDRVATFSDFQPFCEDLDRRLAEFQRGGSPVSLLLVSVDEREKLADSYGTKAVELALRTTSQIIKATIREMDHAARCQETGFGIILPGTVLTDAGLIAERVRVAVENCLLPVNGEQFRFTVSAGLVAFQRNEQREQLLQRAEKAIAEAAGAGGNRTVTADVNGQSQVLTLASV